MSYKRFFLIFCVCFATLKIYGEVGPRQKMDLRGIWSFSLDFKDEGINAGFENKVFSEKVTLPGTTDTNTKGIRNTNREETTFLSRYYKYEGPAWYSKEVDIPSDWNGKTT